MKLMNEEYKSNCHINVFKDKFNIRTVDANKGDYQK